MNIEKHTIIVILLLLAFVGINSEISARPDPFAPIVKKSDESKPAEPEKESQILPKLDTTFVNDRGDYQGYGRDTGGAILLLRAKDMVMEDNDQGKVTVFNDNVKFAQDSITIWCDRARHWPDRQLLRLQGNVTIMDPTRRTDADIITYYEDTRKLVAQGNFKAVRDSVILTSRQGNYDEIEEIAIIRKEMVIDDLSKNVRLVGDYGRWYVQKEKGMVTENPILTKMDSTGLEIARIVSDSMEYDAVDSLSRAFGNVVLLWDDVQGWCDDLYFYPDAQKALLVGDPRILRNRDETLGDSIWIYFTEQEIDSVEVFGQARAFTPADSTENSPRSRMEGKRLVMDFEGKKVVRIESQTQAIGIYHIIDEKDGDQGSNQVSGDKVIMFFEEGKLKDILVNGGTRGTFYPPNLAKEVRKDE